MDIDAARAGEQVAEAADAWLRDPRDVGVYQRLVHAVEVWRHVTRPTLDEIAQDSSGEQARLSGALQEVSAELLRRRTAAGTATASVDEPPP